MLIEYPIEISTNLSEHETSSFIHYRPILVILIAIVSYYAFLIVFFGQKALFLNINESFKSFLARHEDTIFVFYYTLNVDWLIKRAIVILPFFFAPGVLYSMNIIALVSFFEFYIYSLAILFIVFFFKVWVILVKKISNKYLFAYIFGCLFFITLVFFSFPIVMLFCTILTSCLSILLAHRMYFNNISLLQRLILLLKETLDAIGLSSALYHYYSVVFFELSRKDFESFVRIIGSFSLCYVLLAKFYFFLIIIPKWNVLSSNDFLLLSFLICLSLIPLLLRLFLNFANVLVISTQAQNLFSFPVLLVEGSSSESSTSASSSPSPSASGSQPTSATPTNNYWGWNRHTHYNTIHQHMPPKPRFYNSTNLTIGICTLGIGCLGVWLGYNNLVEMRRTNDEMRRQNDIWHSQNVEWRRQNDLAEVQVGILSKEEYERRWPSKHV